MTLKKLPLLIFYFYWVLQNCILLLRLTLSFLSSEPAGLKKSYPLFKIATVGVKFFIANLLMNTEYLPVPLSKWKHILFAVSMWRAHFILFCTRNHPMMKNSSYNWCCRKFRSTSSKKCLLNNLYGEISYFLW